MKRIIALLLLLSSCGINRPKPSQFEINEGRKILGKNWQIDCTIITNQMPGSAGSTYGVVSLFSRDQSTSLSPLRLEKVWFYQQDSLVGTWDDFDKNWQNPNNRSVRYYCRKIGNEQSTNCDKALLRLRNIWGRAYTVAVRGPKSQNVY